MKKLDFGLQGAFSDLNQRTHDTEFLRDFPPNGSFVKEKRDGKDYWYYRSYDRLTGKRSAKYAGPDSNEEVRNRVEKFQAIKADYQSRADLVGALVNIGFPAVDFFTGRIVEELGKAGFFRLRGVLVGTVAFNTFPGLVGALPGRTFQTGDVDFAQDHGISMSIGESMDPVLDVLQSVDQSFRPVPTLKDAFRASQFLNDRGYKVEFLVPNRGSDENAGRLTPMPALGGAAAQPLRYLDFLIQKTTRSTLMHGAGVGVVVPHPARYAVHKLIVAVERLDENKAGKDLAQAAFLVEALAQSGPDRLAEAWTDAWQRGPSWRQRLSVGLERLDEQSRALLKESVVKFAPMLGIDPEAVSFTAA